MIARAGQKMSARERSKYDYDFEQLARRLGQNDPTEWRGKPGANDNVAAKPATPADVVVGFVLGSVLGAAAIYILFFN